MAKRRSSHILNTSSNLLGFCLIVLTSLRITRFNEGTMIDEFTGIAAILFTASSLLSFLSIRTSNENLGIRYESIADMVFIVALLLVFLITFVISFSIIF